MPFSRKHLLEQCAQTGAMFQELSKADMVSAHHLATALHHALLTVQDLVFEARQIQASEVAASAAKLGS